MLAGVGETRGALKVFTWIPERGFGASVGVLVQVPVLMVGIVVFCPVDGERGVVVLLFVEVARRGDASGTFVLCSLKRSAQRIPPKQSMIRKRSSGMIQDTR